jgi:hypothetical protein
MAEGFLAFVDKTELEIDAKPDVEIISKRTSTRYLDVKHESGDKKKENKKEKEKAKDMPSDLPGVPKGEKVKGFLDFIDEEDPKEKIEIVSIRRAPSTSTYCDTLLLKLSDCGSSTRWFVCCRFSRLCRRR